MKIKHILDRFELASIKRMIVNARNVAKYSKHSIFYVLIDMSKCILNDNIGYMEYNLFHFIDKPQEKRNTYIDFNKSQKIFKMLNDRNYLEVFDNKLKFNELFKEYIGRDFVDAAHCSDAQFKKFCKGKTKIFAKPVDSCSGKGIYKIFNIDKKTNINELHKFMIENNLFCEDVIEQHKEMNKLNASSINTIRITTVLHNNKVYPMYALLRVGINNSTVDNVGSGGLYSVISEDGVLLNPFWSDKTVSTYTKHPNTEFNMIGFKIPYFKKAISLCKKAAKEETHIKYVGWDVAITNSGPVIVEGNQLPGYDMPQNYFVTKKDTGLLPAFEEILGTIK